MCEINLKHERNQAETRSNEEKSNSQELLQLETLKAPLLIGCGELPQQQHALPV